MQHLEGSGTPVLYIGRTVLKGLKKLVFIPRQFFGSHSKVLESDTACYFDCFVTKK
jgi:hypothetical protein